jgi:acylphosphatase
MAEFVAMPEIDDQQGGATVVRRRLLIDGRVQGVGYRAAVDRQANRVGVGGQARNLDDGRVEVVLEGSLADVESLVRWCWSGPRMSMVTNITITEEAPTGAKQFRIVD